MSLDIQFNLSDAIQLTPLAAPYNGGEGVLPDGINGAGEGIYLILNRCLGTENRYMGISENIHNRFSGRLGVVFELGFPRSYLTKIWAYIGTVRYRLEGGGDNEWINVNNYRQPKIQFNGINIDYEHLFIKSSHYLFQGTITNTQKKGPFENNTDFDLVIKISWGNGRESRSFTLPPNAFL